MTGSHGVKGFDVPEITDIKYLTELRVKCGNVTEERFNGTEKEFTLTHHFCGKPAIPPTNGGNGGCKGEGGKRGEFQIFGLENQLNIAVLKQMGIYYLLVNIFCLSDSY